MAQPERLCVPDIGDEHTICVPKSRPLSALDDKIWKNNYEIEKKQRNGTHPKHLFLTSPIGQIFSFSYLQ
jgi:hypothetical protein